MVCDKCTTVTTSTDGSDSVPDTLGGSAKRNTQRRSTTRVLKAWLRDHHDKPYPTAKEKELLTQQTGLSLTQINYWFTNARRRYLPKMNVTADGSPAMVTRTTSSPDSIHMQSGEIVDGTPLIALAPSAEVLKTSGVASSAPSTALAAPGNIAGSAELSDVAMATATNALPEATRTNTLPDPSAPPACNKTHTATSTAANDTAKAGQHGANGEAKCKCCDKDTNELEKTMLDFIVKCNAMRSLDGRPGEGGSEDGKRKGGGNRANPATTRILREWLNEHYQHPYPDADEKEELCKQTGMTIIQVNYWFVNARRRYLPKTSKTQSAINSHKAQQPTQPLMLNYTDSLSGAPGVAANATDVNQSLATGQYDVSLSSTTEGLMPLADAQTANSLSTLPPHPVYPMARGAPGLLGMSMGMDLNGMEVKHPGMASAEQLALSGANVSHTHTHSASVSPPLGESSTGGTTSPGTNGNTAHAPHQQRQPQHAQANLHTLAPPPDHAQAQTHVQLYKPPQALSQEDTLTDLNNAPSPAEANRTNKRKLESMTESAGGDDTDEEDLSALVADEAHVHTLNDIQSHTTDTAKRHHSAGSYEGMIALPGGGRVGEETYAHGSAPPPPQTQPQPQGSAEAEAQAQAQAQAAAQAQAQLHAQAAHAHSLALAHASMQGMGMSALSHPGLGMGFNGGMDLNVLPLPVSAEGMMGVNPLDASVANAQENGLYANGVGINSVVADSSKGKAKGATAKSGVSKKSSDSSKVLTTNLLKGWLREHSNNPYPDSAEKSHLREKTGMSLTQINYWFTNARRRYLPQIQNEKNRADEKTAGVEAS